MKKARLTRSMVFFVVVAIFALAGGIGWWASSGSTKPFLKVVRDAFRIGGEFERELVNGYVVFASNPRTVAILAPEAHRDHPTNCSNGLAVAALVDGVSIHGNMILGHVAVSPSSELADFAVPGYFIIDSTSGDVRKGMSRQDWESALNGANILVPPALPRP